MPVWSRLRHVHVGVAALALVAIISLAGCGGGSSTVSSSKEKATTTTTTTTPAAPPSAVPGTPSPVIVKFATDQTQVPCHGTKSSSLTLSWGTENAVNVALRIDGPKIFNTYPATGSAVVPYACPASQHTYLLTANGPNGQTSSQAITVRTLGTPPAPPTTAAPTTTSTVAPTTVAPTTPTTAPTVTKVAVEFTSPERHTYALTVQPTASPIATVEFTVKNSSDTAQDFVVLKTDLPYNQLPVDPHTHQVSEEGKVGRITRIDRDQTKTLQLTLQPGRYVLLSNEPFHYQRGARAPFSAVTTPPTP